MARKHGKDRGVVEKPKGSGVWWVRLIHNGREKWHRCDTKSQAKALYGRLKSEAREGTYFPEKYKAKHAITLREWITRCLEGSSNRDKHHERHRAEYWAAVWGARPLKEIQAADVRQHRAKMLAEEVTVKSGRTRKKWTPATVNRYFAALRRVLRLAIQDGQLDRSPMQGLKFLPEAQKDRFLSDDELLRIQAHAGPDAWGQIAFAIETGLRLSEQFTLRWEQVSFDALTVTLPLPKSGQTKRIPLSDEAARILRGLGSFLESPWVFPDPQDPLKPENGYRVADRFERVLKRAGITGATWHTLRHTRASRLLQAGVDIVTVSKLLGHSNIQTTLRYAHLVKGALHAAANRASLPTATTETGTGSKTGSDVQSGRCTETDTARK
jgi:integrase